ncbi:hypothetical protein AGMMS49957_18910 [Synergistales bacterium]|nr:hypothetical protein AGMMS49957_18910 [Synergistales bacterium]
MVELYLSVVLDCYDGKIFGFDMGGNMRAELCRKAFENACMKESGHGMIFHSDRGSQFTSEEFRDALSLYGAIQSMSGTGRCYDNARMESFFATLKKEKLYKMKTSEIRMDDLKSVIFRYICYHNLRRIYSANGGYPPEVYRQEYFRVKNAA